MSKGTVKCEPNVCLFNKADRWIGNSILPLGINGLVFDDMHPGFVGWTQGFRVTLTGVKGVAEDK